MSALLGVYQNLPNCNLTWGPRCAAAASGGVREVSALLGPRHAQAADCGGRGAAAGAAYWRHPGEGCVACPKGSIGGQPITSPASAAHRPQARRHASLQELIVTC